MGEGEWSPRIFDRSESQQSACDGDSDDCYVLLSLLLIYFMDPRASERSDQEPGGNQANATIDGKEAEEPKKQGREKRRGIGLRLIRD